MDSISASNKDLDHAEIDMEFYGNTTSDTVMLALNVFCGGKQNLAQVSSRRLRICTPHGMMHPPPLYFLCGCSGGQNLAQVKSWVSFTSCAPPTALHFTP